MATFLLSTLIFLVLFAAMAVGVIFSNKPIKGSCGGLNNIGLGGECEICGGDRDKCEEASADPSSAQASAKPSGSSDRAALGYDATRK